MQGCIRDLSHKLSQHRFEIVVILSLISGLVCLGSSSHFKKLIKGWDFVRVLVYVPVCLVIICIILLLAKICKAKICKVPEKFRGLVIASSFVLGALIPPLLEKVLKGGPDILLAAAYGSFALTSLCLSRKMHNITENRNQSEPKLGFQTGFSTLFLGLFSAELLKISFVLIPIVVVLCGVIIALPYYLDSQSENDRNERNERLIIHVNPAYLAADTFVDIDPPNRADNGDINEQTQRFPRMEQHGLSVSNGDNVPTTRDNHQIVDTDNEAINAERQHSQRMIELGSRGRILSRSDDQQDEASLLLSSQAVGEPQQISGTQPPELPRREGNGSQNDSSSRAPFCAVCEFHCEFGREAARRNGQFCSYKCMKQQMEMDRRNQRMGMYGRNQLSRRCSSIVPWENHKALRSPFGKGYATEPRICNLKGGIFSAYPLIT